MTGTVASLNQTGSTSFSIGEILTLAKQGDLRVPSFQRSFVWRAADVRALFDSLYRGFPIGTLLLWKRHGPPGQVSFGPINIEVPERPEAFSVVDGQQRIISFVGALAPEFAGIDDRFEIYFDLATGNFQNPKGGVVPPRGMPLREALDTRSFLNWLRVHDDDLEASDIDAADKLGAVFREYRIPAYIVAGDDQIVLREVFDRVNSAGRPISRAQVFHALFANEVEPGSPEGVGVALLSTGFGHITENRIVQSLLAIRGGNVQRDIHDEFGTDESPLEWYDKTEEALLRAISFLRQQGVHHLLLMPNTLPLPVLAAFFHLHPQPPPWILRLLARWLWRGWVHGFGKEGGQTPVLRRAIRSVYPDKNEINNVPGEFEAVESLLKYVPDRSSDQLKLSNFRTERAETRLILLAMASLKPRNEHGEPLDIANILNAHGANAIAQFVPGHRAEAAARGFWAPDSPRFGPNLPDHVLASHAVDEAAAQALRAGDREGFLQCREKTLRRVVDDFVSNRLEVEALIRPPLADLYYAGREEE